MSIDQEISIGNLVASSHKVEPGETEIINMARIIDGLSGADGGTEYYMDIEVYCDPNNMYGTIAYENPATNKREGHRIKEDGFSLGIRLDDGSEGRITWKHVPTPDED